MSKRNALLICLVIVLAVVPLFMFSSTARSGTEVFAGADGHAEGVIQSLHPDYVAWFNPIWEPPSGEIESLIFALQAALGAGFVGYYLGAGSKREQARRISSSDEH